MLLGSKAGAWGGGGGGGTGKAFGKGDAWAGTPGRKLTPVKPLTSVWPWRGDPGPHSRENSPLLGSPKSTGHDRRGRVPATWPLPRQLFPNVIGAAEARLDPCRGRSQQRSARALSQAGGPGWFGPSRIAEHLLNALCLTKRLTCICSHRPGSTSGHHASPLFSFWKELGAPTSSLAKDRMRILFRKGLEGAGCEFYRGVRSLGLRSEVSLLPNGAESRKEGGMVTKISRRLP